MSKMLLEALKNVDEKVMTKEVTVQIQEAFEAEVSKEADKKVKDLQESIEKATVDMSATILEAFVIDQKELFEKAVGAKADEMSKSGLEKIQEESNAKMDEDLEKIQEDVAKYVKHAADTFLTENKVAMTDEVAVLKANAIMESANIFSGEFQKELLEITSPEENKAALKESVDKEIALILEVKGLKADITLTEAKVGLTLIQADKLDTLCESLTIDDLEAFTKQVNSIKEALVVPEKEVKKIVEKTSKRSWE